MGTSYILRQGDADASDLAKLAALSTYTQTYSTADRTIAAPTAAAITDNSTGAASSTVAAGAGVSTVVFAINAPAITGNVDVLTTWTPGYKFKILAFDAFCSAAVTTGGKAASLNLEIGTTDVTGGVIALSGTYALGATQAGTAITAANTGAANATISIEATGVTAFTEGAFWLIVKIQNMDTADAIASLIAEHTKIVADDLDNRKAITAIIDDLQAQGWAS